MSPIAARVIGWVVIAASCSRPDLEPRAPMAEEPIGDVHRTPVAAPSPPPPPEASAPERGPAWDAQILGVTRAHRAAGLEQATLAQQLARDPRVRALANTVVRDEAEAGAEERAVAEPSPPSATASLDSATIEEAGKRALVGMIVAHSTELDRIYVGAQIGRLRAFLDLLEGTLIPNASSGTLRTYLGSMRGMTASQLKAALSISGSLP